MDYRILDRGSQLPTISSLKLIAEVSPLTAELCNPRSKIQNELTPCRGPMYVSLRRSARRPEFAICA
jgi:hypothetical protein